MPASKHGGIQTDKSDNRKFITFKAGSNGRVVYRKIHLRTKDAKVARLRAQVLEGITDPETARKLIDYLASSTSPAQEQRRVAQLSKNTPLIPALSQTAAREELESIVCVWGDYAPGDLDEEIVEQWRHAVSATDQREILLALGVPDHYLNENPDIYTQIQPRARTINPNYRPRHDAWAEIFRISKNALPEDRPVRGPRLSECIAVFRKDQEQRQNTQKHISSCVNKFKRFVDFLDDKRIRALQKMDFVRYSDHVIGKTVGLSSKSLRDLLKSVEVVLDTSRTRMDDGIFPEGLDNWLNVLKRDRRKRPYTPPRQNREPMPAGSFAALIAKADEFAEMDWHAYADALPIDDKANGAERALQLNHNLALAQCLHRAGLMGHVMLCLAANAGAQSIDFARLLWSELILDGDLPLYREDRSKPAHLLGSEVPRCCPLLPETVRSLKRWQQHRKLQAETDRRNGAAYAQFVFTNSDGRAFGHDDSSGVTRIIKRLRESVDCGHWQFRHLRNIGSTLCRDHHLPEAMADAWLGHSARRTNKFYTGEAKDDYLLPLVTIIGETYFKVNTDRPTNQPASKNL